jgi:hypothetical protein
MLDPMKPNEPMKPHEPMKLNANPQSPFAPMLNSQQTMVSPAKKNSDPKGVPIKAPSIPEIDKANPGPERALSMRDPSDSVAARSKAFNAFFGLFFAFGGLHFGYFLSILSPLGEKWLKFNFGIIALGAVFLGMPNLV